MSKITCRQSRAGRAHRVNRGYTKSLFGSSRDHNVASRDGKDSVPYCAESCD